MTTLCSPNRECETRNSKRMEALVCRGIFATTPSTQMSRFSSSGDNDASSNIPACRMTHKIPKTKNHKGRKGG